MLESMLGPDTMRKIMATITGLCFAILAFIGVMLIVGTSVVPMFHAHFWPAFLIIGCAGGWLMAKGRARKIGLAVIALVPAVWVLLNSIAGWIDPAIVTTANELVAQDGALIEMMASMSTIGLGLAATGALLAIFGSLVGILGAMKYVE